MSAATNFLESLLHNPLLWIVVAAAVLGWLDHRAQTRRLQGYDAWWRAHLTQSLRQFLRGSARR
jgi:hypothetical protein